MAHHSRIHTTDSVGLAKLRLPRDDIVAEIADSQDRFLLAEGPFDRYERTLRASPTDRDRWEVTETFDYRLAVPFWKWLIAVPVRRSLHHPPTDEFPWWSPPDRFDARASRIVALLCSLSIVAAYLGSLLSQTIGLAADEFGASNSAEGVVLAATRAGVVISVAIMFLADRKGRRPMLIFAATVGCLLTVSTALVPSLWTYGAAQTVARGTATAMALLIGVVAAEETPARSRAYVVSVLTLCAGLGSGIVVWFLPLADIGVRAWRWLFVVPLLGLVVVALVARSLPETARFAASIRRPARAFAKRRLALLATTALFASMFAAPASNFLNDFLREDRSFSNADITLFQLVVNTPVGIGVLVGGRLADTRGRKIIGATALLAGAAAAVLRFNLAGVSMWVVSVFGTIVGAAAIPALGVYSFELFGTSRRAESNALVTVAGVAGSAIGLFAVGRASDRIGFGHTFQYMAIAPIIVAVLVIAFYPETAGKELEEINPEDAT